MAAFFRFIAGILIGIVYVLGAAAIGYNIFEEFGYLRELLIAGVALLVVLNITSLTSFPRSIMSGLLVPQIALGMGLGFFYGKEELAVYFTDDLAYRSCVGNFDHKQGIKDCSSLLMKLETKGSIVLKEIDNTSGDYWLAEVLSYRGRHYVKDKQIDLGKADFARALLLPEGVAVTVNNLAEAGYTRSDIFNRDYENVIERMSEDARCMAAASKLKRTTEAAKFSKAVSSQNLNAVRLCRLSSGREEADCDSEIDRRVRSIISLSNRFYVDATKSELEADLNLCQSKAS